MIQLRTDTIKSMIMHALIKKTKATLAVLMLALLPTMLFAQSQPANVGSTSTSADSIWYMLISLAGILVIVISLLSNVLLNLTKLTISKQKAKGIIGILLLLLSTGVFAQNTNAAPVVSASAPFANWNMIMAEAVLIVEMAAILILLLRIRAMSINLSETEIDTKEVKAPFIVHMPKFLDSINASVSIEKEKDILLDHNYDGIQELDNDLPPWWKYSFYLSIIWAVCYFSYYEVLGGPSSKDEYDHAVALAKDQQEEYARKNADKVDENTVVIADAAGIAEGQTIFSENCAACHGKAGEGLVGPNLTDDYWLHGGSINEVFKSIKYGWSAKGMKSWQTDLSPMQIKNVASYIKSIYGTNPANAKAPQGELAAPGDSTSSVKPSDTLVKDTSSVNKI